MRINPYRPSTVHAMALTFGLLAPLAVFGQAPPPAQVASRFAGNWVEDQSQRKTGAERSLTFRNGAKRAGRGARIVLPSASRTCALRRRSLWVW